MVLLTQLYLRGGGSKAVHLEISLATTTMAGIVVLDAFD